MNRKLNQAFQVTLFSFYILEQCFSTFFDSWHPSFVKEYFGGTPSFNLTVNKRQVHNLAAPLELFTAPKFSAAPTVYTRV